MKKFLLALLIPLFKGILWLRYRTEIRGMENLPKTGGTLFLPNHPTVAIDPLLIGLNLRFRYHLRPVIVEYMYYLPVVRQIMDLVDALPIPKFSQTSNTLKKKRSEQVFETLCHDLKRGQNFLIYPAGKVKLSAKENIGGASTIHRILQEIPNVNVVLIRTKGLWGSRFSSAFEGENKTMFQQFWFSIKLLLKNGLFFAPRRHVIIEMVPAPKDLPIQGTRQEFNHYLENWYNLPDSLSEQKGRYPGDSLVLVPDYFWSRQLPKLTKNEKRTLNGTVHLEQIPQDVIEKVNAQVAELAEVEPNTITPEMHLATDLGLDSIDTAELALFLQEQFEVASIPVGELTTVERALGVAARQLVFAQEVEEEKHIAKKWFQATSAEPVKVAKGKTLPECFLNSSKRHGARAALGDPRSGVLTYSEARVRVLLLAQYIQKLKGKSIGILLPASTASTLLIYATQLAGKIPVMINWTVGHRHLQAVKEFTGLQTILTAWSFVDRLENVDLTPIEEELLMLEDVRVQIGFKEKIKAYFYSKLSTKAILNHFCPLLRPDSEAVILFTSGTESLPKGVPLTHHNILSNMRSSLSALTLTDSDIFLGILPPFHSFGFLCSGLIGTIAGIRTVLYPNPTEGKRLAQAIQKWKVTLFAGAPTFIKGILKSATADQLKTLNLAVTGAEKAPPELFDLFAEKGKKGILIEGYGITECSPVLTLTPPGEPKKGVGRPLPEVTLAIVDPESKEPLPPKTRGLIIASGPNIFGGYLNPNAHSPFIEVQGRKWYNTGDLGYIDETGSLHISGRLKRFIKIGAEMVSLPAVEEVLLQKAKQVADHSEGPLLAILGKEEVGEKPKIVAISRFALSQEELNQTLKEAGFSNLVRISAVHKLDEIPIMGSGKINYRALEEMYL
ncbi:MAG: AMP-binding protein [Chlamydiia bacterium]|nr:AMP-binding protein [Chlamydiia bacterium]